VKDEIPVFRMGKARSFFLLFMSLAGTAFSGSSSSIIIYYSVKAINEINIDGSSVTLTVSGAAAGQKPPTATAATTYDITTNGGDEGRKLTAAIDADMPAGVTLSLDVTGPASGISSGSSTITSSPSDVVTMIGPVAQSDIPMSFQLNAAVIAGMISAGSRTLTLTLADQE
jgi:hypothetical protein